MKRMIYSLVFIAALALSACQTATPRRTLEPTSAATQPPATGAPAETAAPGGYPLPTQPVPGGYPIEGAPEEQPMSDLWMAYPPSAGDAQMERGNFLIDSAMLTPIAGAPGTYDLSLEGSLPTPCNQPRVVVNPPDAQNIIQVEAYTVRDTGMVCADVIQPFAGMVATISGLPTGTYRVMVNGEIDAGEVVMP